MVEMGGLGGLREISDPKDPMIPFRISGWCLWWRWVVLVVLNGFPDPKDPMIPFQDSKVALHESAWEL